jgi:ATP synthase F1 delta subunit
MKITAKQYAQSLYETTVKAKQNEIKKIIEKWLQLINNNQDLNKLETILDSFNQIWQTEQGIIEAKVISKHKLEPIVLQILTDQIKKFTKANKVNWQEEQNSNMIGGVIVEYKDQILDASLKTMINDLKANITK